MSLLTENARTVGSFKYLSPPASNLFPLGIVPCDANDNAVVSQYPVEITGTRNTLVGCNVAQNIESGQENTIVGYRAGRDITSASNNVIIGASAGENLVSGASHVIIGHEAASGLLGDRNVVVGNGIEMNGSFSQCIVLGSPTVPTSPTGDNQLVLNGLSINGTAFSGSGGATPVNVETYLPVLVNNVEYRIALYRTTP